MTADGLHRRIIEKLHRNTKRRAIVEVLPARTKIDGVAQWTTFGDWRRKSDGDRVDLFARKHRGEIDDQLLRRVRRA